MAEEKIKQEEKAEENLIDIVDEKEIVVKEERDFRRESLEERNRREAEERLERWVPKTELGKEVRAGKIKSLEEIFSSGRKILEPEIVDTLIKLKSDMLFIGQAKGKFGGGKRRAWKQTQKKTKEGNVPTFSVMAVVGNENGYVGIGYGRAKETLPAREKAIRKAKLNINKVKRGCASFECSCTELHSIPMITEGKCSSVSLKLLPAPQGTGLVAGDEVKKILRLAGIRDVYSKSFGKTGTTINLAKACIQALNNLNKLKLEQ